MTTGVQWSRVWAFPASFSMEGSFLQKKINNNFRKRYDFVLKSQRSTLLIPSRICKIFPKAHDHRHTHSLGTEFAESFCPVAERTVGTTAWMRWRVSSCSAANRRPTAIVITQETFGGSAFKNGASCFQTSKMAESKMVATHGTCSFKEMSRHAHQTLRILKRWQVLNFHGEGDLSYFLPLLLFNCCYFP